VGVFLDLAAFGFFPALTFLAALAFYRVQAAFFLWVLAFFVASGSLALVAFFGGIASLLLVGLC
jgi:hypothetical protein